MLNIKYFKNDNIGHRHSFEPLYLFQGRFYHGLFIVSDGVVGTKWVSNALSEAMEGFAPSSQTNMRCKHESQLYLESLANFTLWAVQSK